MGDRTGLPKLDRTNGYEDGRGYMRAKKSKLAQQNEQIREALRSRHSTMRTDLFKGISINVNGRTQPTADELKRLILLNGGEYHPYYRYQTTKFMIATNLSMARVRQLRPDDRVVKPEWITDSVQAKCILPYQDYQLFANENSVKDPKETLKFETTTRPIANTSNQKAAITDKARPTTSFDRTQTVPTTSSTTSANNNNNTNINKNDKKKLTTLDSFVIRGAVKPQSQEQQFPVPNVNVQRRVVANICGMTGLEDIIGLLNEWVGCPEGITDEDTACVTRYLYDLMSEKSFHNKLYEVMDALRQRISDFGERPWIVLYNDLVDSVKNELAQGTDASQNLCQLITTIELPTSPARPSPIVELHEEEEEGDSEKTQPLVITILDDDID